MRKIKIKILESNCGSGKRDIGPMSGGCGDHSPMGYKNMHHGEEARMHRTTLAHLMADVKVLLDMIQDEDDLPEWLETKITKAGDYMASAARYIAGNVARQQGQLEEKKNCGCGQDPCKTYGTLEEQEQVQTLKTPESAKDDLRSAMDNIENNIDSLSTEQLQTVLQAVETAVAQLELNEIITIDEGLVGLTEEILVESHYTLYDYLQDATDENGETPCPQCLYEVLSEATCGCPDLIPEAKYRGRTVTLNKPTRGDVKKFKVYVKNAKGNVVKVNFGDKKMRIKKSNPKRRKSFRARHNCKNPGPKWKARYWSCRKW